MIEHIITSTVLIFLVFLVSVAFEKHINPCVRYALWLLVAVKLLVPLPTFETNVSVMNVVKQVDTETGSNLFVDDTTEEIQGHANTVTHENTEQAVKKPIYTEPETNTSSSKVMHISISDICKGVWIAGVFLCGGIFLWGNLRLFLYLKKRRVYIGKYKDKLSVYSVDGKISPCLVGILKPAIYLCENHGLKDEQIEHILIHEYTHYRHGDHIWALVRCLCVILYWYHPFVWLAARRSISDGELACDAGALKHIGEQNQIQYGKTLIAMAQILSKKPTNLHVLGCSTGVTGGMREMKKRIRMIVKRPRTMVVTLLLFFLICLGIVGCTFGSAAGEEKENIMSDTPQENSDKAETEIPKEPTTEETKIQEEQKTEEMGLTEEPSEMDLSFEEALLYKGVVLYDQPDPDKVCIQVQPSILREHLTYSYIPEGEKQEDLIQTVASLEEIWEPFEGRLSDVGNGLGWWIAYQERAYWVYEDGHIYVNYTDEAGEFQEYLVQDAELCNMIQEMVESELDYKQADITEIQDIVSAKLEVSGTRTGGETRSQTITDPEILTVLEDWFQNAEYIWGGADCENADGAMELTLVNGTVIQMSIATDDCTNFGINGLYYDYRPAEYRTKGGWYSDKLYQYFDEIKFDF